MLTPSLSVSIIMPLFNNIALSRAAIDAVYANTPSSLDWQLILVDNGSTDATVGERPRDSKTRILRNKHNEGFAKASNQGAGLADGNILVFLNNDTEVQPGWLEALVDELDSHAETGLVGARLLYPNGTVQHAGVVIGRDLIPYHLHRGIPGCDPMVMERRQFPILTGACLAARKKEFMALGMFDEGFINGHEDIDLCFRYRQHGKRCIYRPDCVVIHHESVSSGRFNARLHNLRRTFAKSRAMLVQDDFRYSTPCHDMGKGRLRIAIKLDVPNREQQECREIRLAERLARELTRIGHDCVIHYLCEWGKEDCDIDVVVLLAGPSTYFPKPWNTNVVWLIDGTEQVKAVEFDHYDAVYSEKFSKADSVEQHVIGLSALIASANTPAMQDRKGRYVTTIVDSTYRRNGPCVSVLMGIGSRGDNLANMIRSVIDQTYTNWELCIACEGNKNIDEMIASFADSRIRMVDIVGQSSKGVAINSAFKVSIGEYVAYLCDDDIWHPEHLERLMFALRTIPGISMAYADAEHVTVDPSQPPKQCEVARMLKSQDQVTLAQLLEHNGINPSSVVHARDLFVRVGGFDPKLDLLLDLDMWCRLALVAYPYHVNYVTVDHILSRALEHSDRFSQDSPAKYAFERVRILCKKGFPKNARKRALSNYFALLFDKALSDKNLQKASLYLRLLQKNCTSEHRGQYAYALMKLNRCREALKVFKAYIHPDKTPVADILLAILCAILARDKYALSLVKCLEKSARLVSEEERDLFLDYKRKCEALFAGQ